MKKHSPIQIGDQFGRLTIVRSWGRNKHGQSKWLCTCSCGKETVVVQSDLRSGNTQSCGCLNKELCSTHGMCGSLEYNSWQGMIARCNNPNSVRYANYGGRGVRICPEWDPRQGGSFENFYRDMGPKPSPQHSLDKDIKALSDTGILYSQEYCVWATPEEQQNNKTDTRWIDFQGDRMSVTQGAKKVGMNVGSVRTRLSRGWSVEDALTKPVQKKNKKSPKALAPQGKEISPAD